MLDDGSVCLVVLSEGDGRAPRGRGQFGIRHRVVAAGWMTSLAAVMAMCYPSPRAGGEDPILTRSRRAEGWMANPSLTASHGTRPRARLSVQRGRGSRLVLLMSPMTVDLAGCPERPHCAPAAGRSCWDPTPLNRLIERYRQCPGARGPVDATPPKPQGSLAAMRAICAGSSRTGGRPSPGGGQSRGFAYGRDASRTPRAAAPDDSLSSMVAVLSRTVGRWCSGQRVHRTIGHEEKTRCRRRW